jgi:hypothetical protein
MIHSRLTLNTSGRQPSGPPGALLASPGGQWFSTVLRRGPVRALAFLRAQLASSPCQVAGWPAGQKYKNAVNPS